MGMTMKERKIWLSQIARINEEGKIARDQEVMRQAEYMIELKNREM